MKHLIPKLLIIMLCTMLLMGCAAAPQELTERTLAPTAAPAPSPAPEQSAFQVEPETLLEQVANGSSVLGVLLSRGGNCGIAPEAMIEEEAQGVLVDGERLRLAPGVFYAIAREGRLCYPVLLDWDAGQQRALIDRLTQASFREVEYGEVQGFSKPCVHLLYVTRQYAVWDFALSCDQEREGAPVVCRLSATAKDADGKSPRDRYFVVEGEELDALLADEWQVRRTELPAAEDVVRAEAVNFATGERMQLGTEEIGRMLALMERSQAAPDGEKASVYCEFTWELNSGDTLHGVLDSSFGFIGLEDTLYMLNRRDVGTYTDLFGTFLQR